MSANFIFFQFSLFLIAVLANFLSALAGGGAGLLQLPALIFLGLPFSQALATHKYASVALGIGATLRHLQGEKLRLNIFLIIALCGLPGVLLGAKVALLIPSKFAYLLLGTITILVGIYSSRKKEFGKYDKSNIKLTNLILGGIGLFFIGFLNGSFSSGTGLLVTIWLVQIYGMSY